MKFVATSNFMRQEDYSKTHLRKPSIVYPISGDFDSKILRYKKTGFLVKLKGTKSRELQ